MTPEDASAVPVRENPLDVASPASSIGDPSGGTTLAFSGVVRINDHHRAVLRPQHGAHPGTDGVVADILVEARQIPAVIAAAAWRGSGNLEVEEVAAVAPSHRRDAFDACAWLFDQVKRRLPAWKHHFFADGTHEWVNCA